MSIRHPELCEVVDKLVAKEPPSRADVALLEEYVVPPVDGIEVQDQLDGFTVAAVQELTGRDEEEVMTPRSAAEALLSVLV